MFTDEEIDARKVDRIDVCLQVKEVVSEEMDITMIVAGPGVHWRHLPEWMDYDVLSRDGIKVLPFHQEPSKLCQDIFQSESKVVQ